MTGTDWLLIGVIAGLVGLAALLAVAEIGLVRVGPARAAALRDSDRRGARALIELVERPERFLNIVLLLVLTCQLVAAMLTGILAERHFGALGVAIVATGEVIIIFVIAEAAPKTWAIQHADRAALLSAPIVAVLTRILPLRLLSRGLIGLTNAVLPGRGLPEGPFVSEEELRATADAAAIEPHERELIHSVLSFEDTVAREVMVPRTDIVAVGGDVSVNDALETVIDSGFSRLPVYDGDLDNIVGLIYAKDLMARARDGGGAERARSLMRQARVAPETKKVSELLQEMQAGRFHMAIVLDEYGGTAGLVTLEDVVEELVGEIVDEYDVEEPLVEPLPGGGLRISGRLPVDELAELLQTELPEGDWDTVGGLMFGLLGHVPAQGEAAEYHGVRLEADKVQSHRIRRVVVTRPADADA